MAEVGEYEFQSPGGGSSRFGGGRGPRVSKTALLIGAAVIVVAVAGYLYFGGITGPSNAPAQETTAAPEAPKAADDF